MNPHLTDRRLLPVTLEAELVRAGADSIDSMTHNPSLHAHFNLPEIRFRLIISSISQSLLGGWQSHRLPDAFLQDFKKKCQHQNLKSDCLLEIKSLGQGGTLFQEMSHHLHS